MSTPLEPIYCRKCRAPIAPEHAHCGLCGWDQSRSYALAEIEAQDREAERLRVIYEAGQATEKAQRAQQAAQVSEGQQAAIYNTATGHGVCPNCKSGNVKPYTFTEGGSGAGQSMACCLGCAFNPLAWLLIPLMQGKKQRGFECQYCSNRWRL